jgi:transcriptional regulator GlxA family with amidase domain
MATQQSIPRSQVLNAALGYISQHLAEKICLGDLSSAAGVSNRTVGYLFLRTYGVTPMAFVKGRRLTKAHWLLQRADPATTTVAAIARSCGFTHMGQFSQDYKRVIGESPSATLSRAGGDPGTPSSSSV